MGGGRVPAPWSKGGTLGPLPHWLRRISEANPSAALRRNVC